MKETLGMCIVAAVFFGCERSIVSEPEDFGPPTQVVQVVVIDGFGDTAGLLTGSKHIRVGSYYDFRPFDSLWISFAATRMTTQSPFDQILVRIGPTYYLRDSVYAMRKNVSLSVKVSAISKRQFCALTFLAPDSGAVFQLSDLRVIGWMSK